MTLITELEKRVLALEGQSEDSETDRIADDNETLRKEIARLKGNDADGTQKILTLRRDNGELRRNNVELRRGNGELRKKLEEHPSFPDLEAEIKRLKTAPRLEYNRLKAEIERHKEVLDEKTTEILKSTSRASALKANNDVLKRGIEDREAELKRHTVENIDSQYAGLKNALRFIHKQARGSLISTHMKFYPMAQYGDVAAEVDAFLAEKDNE